MYVVRATMCRIVGWATLRFQGLTRALRVLRTFRGLLETLQELASACQAISLSLAAGLDREGGDDAMRQQLEGLLLTRATWEAEMQALMIKADSTLKSAANAESRTRTMVKHYEKLADPLNLEGEEIEEGVRPVYAERSEEERLQPMHLDVAPNHKQNALRLKFS